MTYKEKRYFTVLRAGVARFFFVAGFFLVGDFSFVLTFTEAFEFFLTVAAVSFFATLAGSVVFFLTVAESAFRFFVAFAAAAPALESISIPKRSPNSSGESASEAPVEAAPTFRLTAEKRSR